MRSEDALLKCDRLCVPSDVVLRTVIMEEVHSPTYAMHTSSTKCIGSVKDTIDG